MQRDSAAAHLLDQEGPGQAVRPTASTTTTVRDGEVIRIRQALARATPSRRRRSCAALTRLTSDRREALTICPPEDLEGELRRRLERSRVGSFSSAATSDIVVRRAAAESRRRARAPRTMGELREERTRGREGAVIRLGRAVDELESCCVRSSLPPTRTLGFDECPIPKLWRTQPAGLRVVLQLRAAAVPRDPTHRADDRPRLHRRGGELSSRTECARLGYDERTTTRDAFRHRRGTGWGADPQPLGSNLERGIAGALLADGNWKAEPTGESACSRSMKLAAARPGAINPRVVARHESLPGSARPLLRDRPARTAHRRRDREARSACDVRAQRRRPDRGVARPAPPWTGPLLRRRRSDGRWPSATSDQRRDALPSVSGSAAVRTCGLEHKANGRAPVCLAQAYRDISATRVA